MKEAKTLARFLLLLPGTIILITNKKFQNYVKQ